MALLAQALNITTLSSKRLEGRVRAGPQSLAGSQPFSWPVGELLYPSNPHAQASVTHSPWCRLGHMSHLLLLGTVSGDVKLALCHEKEDYTCKESSVLGDVGWPFSLSRIVTSIYLCLCEESPALCCTQGT